MAQLNPTYVEQDMLKPLRINHEILTLSTAREIIFKFSAIKLPLLVPRRLEAWSLFTWKCGPC